MEASMENRRAHVFVSGRVQGVFYRANTVDMAMRLGLHGWVRNLRDGRVEIVFEGPQDKINRAIEWCKSGPPQAHVTAVEVEWEKPTGEFDSFGVLY